MALTWDLTGIPNYEDVCWMERDGETIMDPLTNAIIWATMGVGIGHITEKNCGEFYARMRVTELLMGGTYLREGGEEQPITPEDIRKHVGLRTNVFPEETRAKWLKRWVSKDMDEMVRKMKTERSEV